MLGPFGNHALAVENGFCFPAAPPLLKFIPDAARGPLERSGDLSQRVSASSQYLNFTLVGVSEPRPFLFFISQIYAPPSKSQRPGTFI
jgi:hypothetical protein